MLFVPMHFRVFFLMYVLGNAVYLRLSNFDEVLNYELFVCNNGHIFKILI